MAHFDSWSRIGRLARGCSWLPDRSLHRARSSLTGIERQAIELAYFDKVPIEAIAKFLNTSHEEVRQSLVSAMRRLRSLRFVDDEGVTPFEF